ncbi:MAG: hypothetical protein Q8R88_08225 [Desulfoprunum sp.]|nr:hypothetical protein [Desulfoprunum sp.]
MTAEYSALSPREAQDGQLRDELSGAPMGPDRFLSLAIRITTAVTAAVVDIHRQQVIYKNINPATIFFDHRTGTVTRGDFSSSSRLPCEYPTQESSHSLKLIEDIVTHAETRYLLLLQFC